MTGKVLPSAKNGDLLLAIFGMIYLVSETIFYFAKGSSAHPGLGLVSVVNVSALTVAAWMHGGERYGSLGVLVLFALTAGTSWCFESLSIVMGFPFGFYVYAKDLGPFLGEVPVLVLPSYFSMGYFAWTLAHVLVRRFDRRLAGGSVFAIPLVAAFLTTMWDLCFDPVASTVLHAWTWRSNGDFLGVPYSNFFGWLFTLFVIFQLFAFSVARSSVEKADRSNRPFRWYFAVVMYSASGIQTALTPLINPAEIYRTLSLISLFTMVFISGIGFLGVWTYSGPFPKPRARLTVERMSRPLAQRRRRRVTKNGPTETEPRG